MNVGKYYVAGIPFDSENSLKHYGVKGMEWNKHKFGIDADDRYIKWLKNAGQNIGRFGANVAQNVAKGVTNAARTAGTAVNKGANFVTGNQNRQQYQNQSASARTMRNPQQAQQRATNYYNQQQAKTLPGIAKTAATSAENTADKLYRESGLKGNVDRISNAITGNTDRATAQSYRDLANFQEDQNAPFRAESPKYSPENLRKEADKYQRAADTALIPSVQRVAGNVGNAVSSAARDVGNWAGQTAQNIGNSAPVRAVGQAAQNVGNAVSGAANAVGDWAGNTAQNVGNFVDQNITGTSARNAADLYNRTAQNPNVDSVQRVMNQRAAENAQSQADSTLFGKVGNTAQNVGNAVSGAANKATEGAKGFLNSAGQWVSGAANNVKNTASKAASDAKKGASGFLNSAGQWVSNAAGNVKNATQNVGNTVGQVAQNVGNTVGQAAQNVGNTVGQAAEQARSGIGGFFDRVGNAVGGAAQNVGNTVGQAAQNVGNAVGGAAQNVGNWAGNAAKDVGNAVSGAANAVGDWAGNAAQNVGGAVQNAGQAVGNFVDQNITGNSAREDAQRYLNYARKTDDRGGNWELDANGNRTFPNDGSLNTNTQYWANKAAEAQQNADNSLFGRAANAAEYLTGNNARNALRDAKANWDNYVGRPLDEGNIDYAERTQEVYGPVLDKAQEAYGRTLPGTIGNAAYNVANSADNWLDQHNPNLRGNLLDTARNIGNAVSRAAGNVGNAVSGAAGNAADWARDAADNVGNWAGQAAQNVGNAVSGAADWGRQAAQNVGNFVSEMANPHYQLNTQQMVDNYNQYLQDHPENPQSPQHSEWLREQVKNDPQLRAFYEQYMKHSAIDEKPDGVSDAFWEKFTADGGTREEYDRDWR